MKRFLLNLPAVFLKPNIGTIFADLTFPSTAPGKLTKVKASLPQGRHLSYIRCNPNRREPTITDHQIIQKTHAIVQETGMKPATQASTPLDAWIAKLAQQPLPALSHSRAAYMESGGIDTISVTQLSNIVLTDPGLIVTLLREACAVPRKRMMSEINTIDSAILMLGIGNTARIIENAPSVEERVAKPVQEEYLRVLSRAYHSACQAYAFARSRVELAPEEIFLAAMLQEVGTLALWAHSPKTMLKLRKLAGPGFFCNEQAQHQVLGLELRALSSSLVEHWGLSSFIQSSLDPQTQKNNRIQSVGLGRRVGQAADMGWDTPETGQLLEELATFLHMDVNEAYGQIRSNAEQAAEETPFIDIQPAAQRLPSVDAFEEHRAKAAQPAPQPSQTTPATPAASRRKTAPPPAAKIGHLTDIRHQLDLMLKRGDYNIPELMALVTRGLHEGLNLSRAFFAAANRARTTLNCHYSIGDNNGQLEKLSIPITTPNLFLVLLQKPQALWVREHNRAKVWHLVPPDFATLIGVNSFFVMTILARGKPVGMIYADRYDKNFDLDQQSYDLFRQWGQIVAKGLN